MDDMRKRWHDLTDRQRRTAVVAIVVTGVLQAVMLWDLWRRPTEQIRGTKRVWVVASFVRPIGQIAYVVWGRRPNTSQASGWVPRRAPEVGPGAAQRPGLGSAGVRTHSTRVAAAGLGLRKA